MNQRIFRTTLFVVALAVWGAVFIRLDQRPEQTLQQTGKASVSESTRVQKPTIHVHDYVDPFFPQAGVDPPKAELAKSFSNGNDDQQMSVDWSHVLLAGILENTALLKNRAGGVKIVGIGQQFNGATLTQTWQDSVRFSDGTLLRTQ